MESDILLHKDNLHLFLILLLIHNSFSGGSGPQHLYSRLSEQPVA